MSEYLFTSESVTEGHPDKLADQISDAVLDAVLAADPRARVACETYTTTGLIVVGGEISTEAYVDVAGIARGVVRDAGYTRAKYGFDADTCSVLSSIDEQSEDIAWGVNKSYETRSGFTADPLDAEGAGDQGMMFGYATDETPELMPLPIMAAHRLARALASARKDGVLPWLRPDGKTQVTVRYVDDRPVEIVRVLVSAQHDPDVADEVVRDEIWDKVVLPTLRLHYEGIYDADALRRSLLVNPAGRFVSGGPHADVGLTGRKIIVDTYGGMARHGGGAFSGKDPSKVDRSGAYAARYVAKNIVAAGLARRCEVQIAYAIGVATPISLMVNAFGTEAVPEDEIQALIEQHFDLRPAAIIRDLDLRRPIYRRTATYGHFGREHADFTWERTDKAVLLKG